MNINICLFHTLMVRKYKDLGGDANKGFLLDNLIAPKRPQKIRSCQPLALPNSQGTYETE